MKSERIRSNSLNAFKVERVGRSAPLGAAPPFNRRNEPNEEKNPTPPHARGRSLAKWLVGTRSVRDHDVVDIRFG